MKAAGLARWGLALAALVSSAWAQDPLEAAGFQHFYNLEYDDAIAAFEKQTAAEPREPSAYNHLAQAVLFRDLYRAGALETELVTGNNPFLRRPRVNASAEDQKSFEEAIRRAMELARERLRENARDTHALYALGVSYGLRANCNFLVRKAWRDALNDATAARKAHNRVTEIDPSFVDARMVQGLHDYVVGSLPLHYRMLGFLIGFRGNRESGIRSLELVAKEGDVNRLDARILLCAIYRREHRPRLAIPLLEELIERFPRNYLFPMELAQMYGDLGEKDKALAALRRLEALKRMHPRAYAALRREKIWFAEGTIQFWYDDLDEALANLRRAASAAEDLDLNTGVMAWMRLGQIYDLKGQRVQAVEAYQRAIAFAPDSDAARESRLYLSVPYHRKRA